MTRQEYEKKIAHGAGLTVDAFRAAGGRVVNCECRGPLCREGWDVRFVSERGEKREEEHTRSSTVTD